MNNNSMRENSLSQAAMPSSDPSQRPRRVRTSRPKVKTGCNNCKKRRIKCDERRPECTNCVRSRKECTGYPPPPRPRIFEEVRIAPKPGTSAAQTIQPREPLRPLVRPPPTPTTAVRLTPPSTPVATASLTVYRPATSLPFDPQEGLYFQLFREHTANELSGFFDTAFWTRCVLQECHSEAAIRYSVVALGALYKTLEKMTESPPGSPSEFFDPADQVNRHWEVAFKHYSLAINAVVKDPSSSRSAQRTRLMASVLLACFDSFIGDHKPAIKQIQTGLQLLETVRAERRRAFLPSPEEPVEQELIQMFTRLAIQAKSYDMAFHFPHPYVVRLTPQSSEYPASPSSEGGSPTSTNQSQIPEVFDTLHEARLAWDTLCEKIMRFTETMFTFVTMNPMGVLPASLQKYGSGFREQVQAWTKAFEPILASRTAPSKSSQEKTAIAVLKMNQIMGTILFSMTYSDNEMAFDAFLPRFQEIVGLATEVIGDEERRAAARRCPNPHFCPHQSAPPDQFANQYTARHIKASFSADLGIVPPLFVVATKCRDRIVRRQAIQLLRTSSRREGMWDSELAAHIGYWIMTIEEGDDNNDGHNYASPESQSHSSPILGDDAPLGPGGNARWGSRRESTQTTPPNHSDNKTIPEEKRVMVRAVEFDLRRHRATLQCGTRGLIPGMPDLRTRTTTFTW
ncbi:hypothetical protein F4810DRAFT_139856 [Camillea tinctor]|nr:hypothetical protein F4810DRAFT_139856 [Camillea tinctor]